MKCIKAAENLSSMMKSLNSIIFLIMFGVLSGQSLDSLGMSRTDYKRDFLQLDSIASSQSIMYKKFNYNKIYQKSLGVFCRVENKASKHAPVQLRMRLGSLEYVDRLEQKQSAVIVDKR